MNRANPIHRDPALECAPAEKAIDEIDRLQRNSAGSLWPAQRATFSVLWTVVFGSWVNILFTVELCALRCPPPPLLALLLENVSGRAGDGPPRGHGCHIPRQYYFNKQNAHKSVKRKWSSYAGPAANGCEIVKGNEGLLFFFFLLERRVEKPRAKHCETTYRSASLQHSEGWSAEKTVLDDSIPQPQLLL